MTMVIEFNKEYPEILMALAGKHQEVAQLIADDLGKTTRMQCERLLIGMTRNNETANAISITIRTKLRD